MGWMGSKLKDLASEKGLSLTDFAKLIGVSRQTVNDWIKGQIPKGNHLVKICRSFEMSPNDFFSQDVETAISVPAHRKRGRAKITTDRQKEAIELVKGYELLFRNAEQNSILPVIRPTSKTKTAAMQISEELRALCNAREGTPLDYEETFELLSQLGIVAVFRYFPENIKSYAFYTKVHAHRVIFINNSTNVLDLIFPLIHESVHAIRDEAYSSGMYDTEEEDFCDYVASYVQFPEEYVKFIHESIQNLTPAQQVNQLKLFGKRYNHALYGLVKRIQSLFPSFKLNVSGADNKLRKNFTTIGDILFGSEDPEHFLYLQKKLSPWFIELLLGKINNISQRKVGELLDLENFLDATSVYKLLQKASSED
ncbi:MAG: helix-turn-helix transcriptional regulator [Desulfoferrobacter sp.]